MALESIFHILKRTKIFYLLVINKRVSMRLVLTLMLIATVFNSYSQDQEVEEDTIKNRYIVGLLPNKSPNIYGLALGLIGSEVRCDKFYTKKSHGLNIQLLGQGFFTPFYVFNSKLNWSNYEKDTLTYGDSTDVKRVVHNGLLISVFGTFSEDINGVSISPWMSMNHKVNGLNLNLLINSTHTMNGLSIGLYNSTYKTNGVQVGLVNQTKKLKGFQFGIWNVNNKRKLPFINWCFTD
ncbi:MAG: hypothetical protein COA32_05420 [Fluviicola sp.]|nr:MAG: hypothetical protein COA32_05420 [Fluviicola sp.]